MIYRLWVKIISELTFSQGSTKNTTLIKKQGVVMNLWPCHMVLSCPALEARFTDYSCSALIHTHSSNIMQSHCALINLNIIPDKPFSLSSAVGGRRLCVHRANEFTVRPQLDQLTWLFSFFQKYILSSHNLLDAHYSRQVKHVLFLPVPHCCPFMSQIRH